MYKLIFSIYGEGISVYNEHVQAKSALFSARAAPGTSQLEYIARARAYIV